MTGKEEILDNVILNYLSSLLKERLRQLVKLFC
jgi:hypothetical protein